MSAHVIVCTDDSVELTHPPACRARKDCPEGQYEERCGLEAWALWPSGDYPVAYWSGFYEGEYDEGLARVYDRPCEVAEDGMTCERTHAHRGLHQTPSGIEWGVAS